MPSTKLSFCLKGMSPHPPQSRGRAKGEKRADRHNKKEKPSSRRLPFQSERHTRKSPFPAHLEEGGRPASEGLALLSSSTLLNDPLILSLPPFQPGASLRPSFSPFLFLYPPRQTVSIPRGLGSGSRVGKGRNRTVVSVNMKIPFSTRSLPPPSVLHSKRMCVGKGDPSSFLEGGRKMPRTLPAL